MLALDTQLNKLSKFGKFKRAVYRYTGTGEYGSLTPPLKTNLIAQGLQVEYVSITKIRSISGSWTEYGFSFGVYEDSGIIKNRVLKALSGTFGNAYNITSSHTQDDGTGASANTGINLPNRTTSGNSAANWFNQSSGTYTVQRGDTLAAIAKKFKTTVSVLATLNGIANVNSISVGQVLKVTGTANTQTNTNTNTNTGNNNSSNNTSSNSNTEQPQASDTDIFTKYGTYIMIGSFALVGVLILSGKK